MDKIAATVDDHERRLGEIEQEQKCDHDTITTNTCEIDTLQDQGEKILGRLDEQDKTQEDFRIAVFKKINNFIYFLLTTIVAALISTFLWFHH